jgi:hypothetical protein
MEDMAVNPISRIPAPPATPTTTTAPTNAPARSTSPPTTVTDTVHLSAAAQAAVISPQETALDETDTQAQLLKAALNGDPVARNLLNALASIPPPQVP